MKQGKLYRIQLDGYSSEGAAVGRMDGQVVFVQGGLSGELCDVRIEKIGRSAAFGRVERVIRPSNERCVPECPHFPSCGGCNFWHMSYTEELKLKRQRVEDALCRIGGWDGTVKTIIGAEHIENYRNKAQFPVAPGEDGPRVGFYRARSHEVIPVKECKIQNRLANQVGEIVREWMEQFQIPAYDERSHEGLIRHIYVRTNRKGEGLLCLITNGESIPKEEKLVMMLRERCPNIRGVVQGINTLRTNVILGDQYRTVWGEDYLVDTLCQIQFRLSVPSFFQVNREQTERLYAEAVKYAGLTGGETVLDLYCGIGTISLAMAKQAGRVIGAEIVPEAIRDAQENAQRAGFSNVEFLVGDAGEVAGKLSKERLRPDVISVDPPRKGLSESVIASIVEMNPKRVVYVSCDPATMARDVKRFREVGYALKEATAVDMFPRTANVETIALLQREN